MLIIIFMVSQTLQLGQLNKDISTPDLIRVKRVYLCLDRYDKYILLWMSAYYSDNDVVTYHNIGIHFDNDIFEICIASRDMCQQMVF